MNKDKLKEDNLNTPNWYNNLLISLFFGCMLSVGITMYISKENRYGELKNYENNINLISKRR